MTFLDSTDTENTSTLKSTSTPLHFYKSFRKIKEEERTQKLEIDNEKSMERKLNKKQAKSDNFNSSSSVSSNPTIQISKRSIVQEQLFRSQCASQYGNASQESSSSADSFFASSTDESDKCVGAHGLLHLNKPLFQDNAKKYYEDRGRMPIADWKSGGSSCLSQEKVTDIVKRPEMQKKTIATAALSKPKVSDEFSNFVENSVSNKTAYSIEANVEKNSIDNPFFKIQQLINRRPLEAIQIPASVRASFLKTSSDCHLLNNIDIFRAVNPITTGNSKAAETARQEKRWGDKRTCGQNVNSHSHQFNGTTKDNDEAVADNVEKHSNSLDCTNQSKQIMRLDNHIEHAQNQTSPHKKLLREGDRYFDTVGSKCVEEGNITQNEHSKSFVSRGKEINTNCPNLDFDDSDVVSYVNSLTNEENTAKRESRRNALAVKDDQFAFVQNPPESNYQISSPSVPSATKISKFDRVKAVCREKVKVNRALDSDDTFNVSSDLESSSASKVSMQARFEKLRQKMNKISSSCNGRENTCILPDDNDSEKVLENRNQLLNRCLRGTHDYFKVHENNVVEITRVKVGPKPELLLKPISTRYFDKPSTAAGELCKKNNNLLKEDIKIGEEQYFMSTDVSNLKTALLDSSPSQNLDEGKTESANADFLIDNVGSANSKSNFDNVSNVIITNDICAEFCQKDEEIKSDLIIDDAEIDNKEHCNLVSKHEEITRPASITKKARESPKILEKLDINDNYDDDDDDNDVDGFDIENILLFLQKDKNKMKVLPGEMTNGSGLSIVDKDHNISEIQSLKSENSSNSKYFNINENIFNNVNIELSKLKTDGLAFDEKQTNDMKYNDIISLKNETLQQNVHPLNNIGNVTSKQISCNEKVQLDYSSANLKPKSVSQGNLHHQEKAAKENIEQSLNDNDISSSKVVGKLQSSNENVAATKQFESKKMKKYRITLENFKHKSSSETDKKEENKKVQQSDDAFEIENSHMQESLSQRPILKEIQKQKLHFALRQFV